MTTIRRAIPLTVLLAACGGGGTSAPDVGGKAPDAGSVADAGSLPEYALEIGATLTVAANAMAGSNVNVKDPTGDVVVKDLTPVVYSAKNTVGGSSSTAKVEFKRAGHTLTILADTWAASVAGASAQGSVQPEIHGICAKARGAKSFKVSWACDVTTFEAAGHSSAGVSVGSLCSKQRVKDEKGAVVQDADWAPKSSERTVAATDGQACWDENASVVVQATGGLSAGTASNVATVTLTVDPVY